MEKKNGASIIRLTRIFKEAREMHLDAASALKIGGRFKNTTPVTESASVQFFRGILDSMMFLMP